MERGVTTNTDRKGATWLRRRDTLKDSSPAESWRKSHVYS